MTEISYPESWKVAQDPEPVQANVPDFISRIAIPILALKGDNIPVSELTPDGGNPVGTTAYEKRGVAISIPEWDSDKCIECCQCSLVCPHAAIRPVVASQDELKNAPSEFVTKKVTGDPALENLNFRIQVYPDDCLGCGSCVDVCPAKALTLKPWAEQRIDQVGNLCYAQKHIGIKDDLLPRNTVKGSQLQQPLFEFSGACAGCGETPYIKLVTQLFGERLIIANATGCSSIYGASMPSFPYTVNKNGQGPAWGNSLFEDAAEYGYGIATAVRLRRDKLELLIDGVLAKKDTSTELQEALNTWKTNKDDNVRSYALGKEIIRILGNEPENPVYDEIKQSADQFGKKSVWIVGGDGWAYDIGFGGLDHVLASGENINMLVLDTECYSNTGGQMSKATPLGAIAKFASAGKRSNRKNLGRMLMTYDNVYVASIALGANKQQSINALMEAEAYNGPSIVIAYCPCINHGIRKGMGTSMYEEKHAVSSGYWPLYRFNPVLAESSKSPFILDYMKSDGTMPDFLDGEDRYAYLMETLPDEAKILREKLQKTCDKVYQTLYKEGWIR
ncbi:MAG: 4Fe-4S binding protein [Bacteroides intestinalis]|nr:4Fe-4S binding protein [Bacteroides intestinalis]